MCILEVLQGSGMNRKMIAVIAGAAVAVIAVAIINSDGTRTESSTVFSRNLPFFVNVDGDYIFTKVT